VAVGGLTDQELLAAVADGDRGALRELRDCHVVWVTLRLRRRCTDGDAVAEAVQDTPALQATGLAVVAVVAVVLSRTADATGPFLVLAPLVPLAAVAASFASTADPAGARRGSANSVARSTPKAL
jgi:hypothetical protein